MKWASLFLRRFSTSAASDINSSFNSVAQTGFGASVIDSYESGRPEYSRDSTSRLFVKSGALANARKGLPLLEVACGTGKFTRAMLSFLAHERVDPLPPIHLVDPADMSVKIEQEFPSLSFRRTVAADLSHLQSGSMGAIFVAQAFHWFANKLALDELHRVLSFGSPLCLLWNTRDRSSSPLMADLEAILDTFYDLAEKETGERIPRQTSGDWRSIFVEKQAEILAPSWSPIREERILGSYSGTEQQIVQWMLSISVVSRSSEAQKARVEDETRRLCRKHAPAVAAGAATSGRASARLYTLPRFTDLCWMQKM